MPAMPMADSNAPIVVGARHTNRATSTVRLIGCPWPETCTLKIEYGSSVATTSRKTSVSAASRIARAISLGVFCRLAPSTIAIMRSRKLWPGQRRDADDEPVGNDARAARHGTAVAAAFAHHRGTFARDRALIDRSHAFDDFAIGRNRLTGFDDHDVADDRDRWPERVDRRSRGSGLGAACCAITDVRVFRSDAAWALPCPSAIASAKLANNTVNHSQTATPKMNPDDSPVAAHSEFTHSTVVRMLPR